MPDRLEPGLLGERMNFRWHVLLVWVALAWSALCLVLYAGGHSPSRVSLPVAPEIYYALQAVALPFIVALQLRVAAFVLQRMGDEHPRTNAARAIALTALACFVVPDFVALAFFGADALRIVVRVAGPAALLVGWVLFARGIPGTRMRRVGGALLALLAQGAVAGVFVR